MTRKPDIVLRLVRPACLAALLVLTSWGICPADRVTFKNGKIIEGETVWVEGDQVKIQKYGATIGYPFDSVLTIEETPWVADGAGPQALPEDPVDAEAQPPPAPTAEPPAPVEAASVTGKTSVPKPKPLPPAVSDKPAEAPARKTGQKPFYSMTIQEFIAKLRQVNPLILLGVFLFPPVGAFLYSHIHPQGTVEYTRWRYGYSFFVYLTAVPGIFACVITAYTVFFLHQSLLSVNVFVYFLPIVSMIVTLVIVNRNIAFTRIPGVDRLFGLVMILAISFSAALAIQKTRIWIFFGGSIKALIIIAIVCFIVLKAGIYMLFRKKKTDYPYA